MQAKIVPWWRRAFEFALGGIRSGFGLFSRHAQPAPVEPVEENSFLDRPKESLEVKTVLTNQTNSKNIRAATEAVAAPTPAAEPTAEAAAEPLPKIVAEIQPSSPIAPVDAAVIEPPAEPEQEIAPQTEAEAEPDQQQETETESVAEVSSATETIPVAFEPALEPETALQPELDAEPDPQQEPEEEPTTEDLTAADSIPTAEPTPAEEPLVAEEPDPLPEQVEPMLETIEAESDLIEPLLHEPAAPEPVAEAASEPESTTAAAEPAPISDPVIPVAPAVEAPVAEVPEPAPVPETPPPPTPKPFIKLESRDDEANLSPFSVVVEQIYDGPLDLLLDLIRKQDIDVYDIPIAKITAQFLAYVNQLKATDVDVAGEFIYIASLLIHIKSKMLLPRAPSGPEEAADDPRRELVERLLEHERFKNAAQMLQQKQMLEAATWSNPGFREFQDDVAAEPEIAADTVDLVRIFRDILERIRSRPVFDVDEDAVTVGQMIQFLARRLTMEDKPVALRRLLSHTRSARALIAIFLALLELVRLQAVLLRQDRAFSEIFVKKHTGFDAVMNEGLANAHDDWK